MDQNKFMDSYIRYEDGYISFCYRTNRLSYEEILKDGVFFVGVWNTAGFCPLTKNVKAIYRLPSDRFHYSRAFELNVNGKNLTVGYTLVDYNKTEEAGGLHVAVTLANEYEPIRVTVHTFLDGTDVLQRWLTLENLSDAKMPVGRISVMSGSLYNASKTCNGGKPYRFGSMVSGAWAWEGDYHTMLLPEGEYCIHRTDPADRFRAPFFTVENLETGVITLGQLGFSGEYKFHFQSSTYGGEEHLSYRIDLSGDYFPVLTLDEKEAFDTPSFHLCMLSGGLDDAVNQMNDHVRNYAAPYRKDMIIEKAIGPEVDMSLPMVLKSIDKAAEYGAELYFIDASWFGPDKGEFSWDVNAGDWFPKESRYAMPMAEIAEYAHGKGLKFGLWVEIEKIQEQSELFDTEYPPKLRMPNGKYWQPGKSRHIDMSKKEGAEWVYNTICRMVEEYHLDFFRIDYNICPIHATVGLSGAFDLRYYQNWYDVLKRVQKKYPDLIIQNCASGGARLDLGMVSVTANSQLTDQQTPPMTFKILNGVSMQLPPEYFIQAMVAGNGHLRGSDNFQIDICRFGNPLISWNVLPDGVEDNREYVEKVARAVETYREFVRPNLPGCRIYHHTPDVDVFAPDTVGILELGAKDRKMSMVGVFALTKPANPEITFRFRGLDPSRTYRIYMQDMFWGVLPGSRLTLDGFTVRIENAVDSVTVLAVAQ